MIASHAVPGAAALPRAPRRARAAAALSATTTTSTTSSRPRTPSPLALRPRLSRRTSGIATTPATASSARASIPRLASSLRARASKNNSGASGDADEAPPATARLAVERGLEAFREKKDYERAARLFQAALELKPSSEEAAAALYNRACALAKLRRWQQASDALASAVDDHGLKLSVAASDPDFADFRDTREWIDLLARVRGGLSREAKMSLRTEARAPFRLARTIIFGSLAAGAGLGLIVILGRLVASLKGGEGAPPLSESLQNLAINSAALGGLGFLLLRDLAGRERDLRVTQREEGLGRLLVDLGRARVLPLIRFRGAVRPLIVAGDRAFVERQLREAEPRVADLRARGVSVVPVVYASDPDERLRALRREFQQQDGGAAAAGVKGFSGGGSAAAAGKRGGGGAAGDAAGGGAAAADGGASSAEGKPPPAAEPPSPIRDADKKWRLEPSALPEWERWVLEQRGFAGLAGDGDAARNVWIQVALDGTVRSSDRGTVPWAKIVRDLPPLDNLRTLITDGVGTSI